MEGIILVIILIAGLAIGGFVGYYFRKLFAMKEADSAERKAEDILKKAKERQTEILLEAKDKALKAMDESRKESEERRQEVKHLQERVEKREATFDKKLLELENKQQELYQKAEKVEELKQEIIKIKEAQLKKLEEVAKLSVEEAKKVLLDNTENRMKDELLLRVKKLQEQSSQELEDTAKDLLTSVIQRCASSHAVETTTTVVSLPNDEMKGRIIGREGRNIKALEQLTGVEIVVDETPESVIISGFDPVRRQVAKIALEKLVKDGRIQPARIEEKVAEAQKEIASQMKEAGEAAVYDVGLLGLDPRLVQLLGRLKFRTSYGQNVLLHSIEVAHLAGALAAEIGADVQVCKKAGLLHDIGKAVDQEVEGSHIEIGIKILEKFGEAKEIIQAMRSHHEDYPYETLEAVLIQTADQISGARPGARKDTIENYLRRLADLENIALSFGGVEKAWALQAGREIRVFVKPEQIDDFGAQKLAKEIAKRIQDELRYPGEVKVNVIRETRVVEYAK